MPRPICPLCTCTSAIHFHSDSRRDYFRCQQCSLVFVPKDQHLSAAAEKAIYDMHCNDTDDLGYRRFLSRITTPLLQLLDRASKGLDYGCGPGPLLAKMLTEHGHNVTLYDPFYAADYRFQDQRYRFITCTEVAEHFRHPAREFELLFGLLEANGILALMTKLVKDADAFAKWHYKNDPTHICYYSRPTLQWLALRYDKALSIVGSDVILFTPSNQLPAVTRI